jgi:hypothetical protein
MKKTGLKRKRVTVSMEPDLYAAFHRFAESRSLSDDRAGSVLIGACFKGTVYSWLQDVAMKSAKGK